MQKYSQLTEPERHHIYLMRTMQEQLSRSKKSVMYRMYGMPILQEQKPVMYRTYGMPILQEQKIGVITAAEEVKRGHYCFGPNPQIEIS